jgi:replication factor A1
MIEIILEEKQDLDYDKLKALIEEKKANVGAGYLTDQGALFLVAADLGISLERSPKSEYGLKDIFVGARDISILGRIITINPIKTFLKRDSDQESRNRTLTIFDKDSSVRIKLWDDLVDIPEMQNLKVGDLIRVTNCQIKSGLDNRPVVNLGNNGNIEVINDDKKLAIPSITDITKTIEEIPSDPMDNIAIIGKIVLDPRITQFTNNRGELSKSLHLMLSNEDNTRQIRSIIWNVNEDTIPKLLTRDSQIKLIGVRTKIGNPNFGNGDMEIHGDEGTTIELVNDKTSDENFLLRIVSKRVDISGNFSIYLTINSESNPFVLKINNEIFDLEIDIDDIIECYPSRVLGNTVEVMDQNSFIQKIEGNEEIPDKSVLEIKIRDIATTNRPYIIEAIVLQNPNRTEVNTKSGDTVAVADTIVGDDTGEIRLVGWRDNSMVVNQLKIGERIRLIGVEASQGKEGSMELSLRSYSDIAIIN